ncbi:hypothetical protein L9F63_026458, partial [Diploptera punctata]
CFHDCQFFSFFSFAELCNQARSNWSFHLFNGHPHRVPENKVDKFRVHATSGAS